MKSADSPAGQVQTVLGPHDPAELGHVQIHEHVWCDLSLGGSEGSAPAIAGLAGNVTLENVYRLRRYQSDLPEHQLQNEADALTALQLYRDAGGRSIVDSSVIGLGRDVERLAAISRTSGVHIVAGTGFYVQDAHPDYVGGMSREQVAELFTRELREGVDDTGIRCGIIGELGCSWPTHPHEEKVLCAGVDAQRETGVMLQVHPGRHPDAPRWIVDVVKREGGDPERLVVCHLDRTYGSLAQYLALADTGCFLELDLFGKEMSYYPFGVAPVPNDAERVRIIAEVVARGHLRQIVISQDICHRVFLQQYGGEGYHHILEHVVPLMRSSGLSDDQIRTICQDNPQTALTPR